MIQSIKKKYYPIGQRTYRPSSAIVTRDYALPRSMFESDFINTNDIGGVVGGAPDTFSPRGNAYTDYFPTDQFTPTRPIRNVTPVVNTQFAPDFIPDGFPGGFFPEPTYIQPDNGIDITRNPVVVDPTRTNGRPYIPRTSTTNIGSFSRFNMMEDVLQQQTEVVTGGVWSTGEAALDTHWSSSVQTTSQRRYYVEVYDSNPTSTDAVSQYSIAYGHALGSGSSVLGQLNDSPSRAVYSQFRQLLLPAGTSRFNTYGSGSTDSIYVVSFNRNRLKERLDPGNFELPLMQINTRATNATGSVTLTTSLIHTLIDDSSISTGSLSADGGRVYNLVSGSLQGGVYNSAAPVYYGTVYPDYGCIIVDGNVLDQKLTYATNKTSNSEGNNHFAMFRSISGSGTQTNPATTDTYGFLARNSEKITSTHYFVRIKNGQFNYSNNPSFISGSNGDILTSFLTDPVTYITTIGLYNDQQELLAIAKVSQPILKSFSRESLIRVKLDF